MWGAKDGQWDWLYSTKDAGRQYDPMVEYQGNDPTLTPAQNELAKGRPYNGDLWSTAEPAGNTCRNWGTPNGYFSPEGFTIHNCQWPSPTSGHVPGDALPPVLDRQLGGRGRPVLLAARRPGRLQHREPGRCRAT